MIRGKPLYAFIPVRGGSKGIPGKNLHRLGGETLLERTIRLAENCRRIDRIMVSTDHQGMWEIARARGVATPALRPAHLATTTARTVDVVLHHLNEAAIETGFVVLLQVTTPLRNQADLSSFLDLFENAPEAKAAVSLAEHGSPHPLKLQVIRDGIVQSYAGVESMVPRQELPPVYALNGAFYLTSVETLRTQKTFMPTGTAPFVMPEERSVNLDSPLDLLLAEALVERGIVALD